MAARRAGLLAGTAGLIVTGLTPAVAAAPADRPAAVAAPGAAVAVPLPTGDWVQLRTGPDGQQTGTVRKRDRHGIAGSFRTERRNGDLYVIPAVADPYLGRILDPALFDVSQLARTGAAGGRLPVRLTYRAGAAHHAVPGVTVTGTQGDTVDGYLTAASAGDFGQALAAQVAADAAAHWPIGAGIFAGLTGLRFAGPAAAPPVQPHFPMFTLRITVTGQDGQPAAFGDLTLANTDDGRKFNGFPAVSNGEARVSVPAGHYGLLVHTFDPVGDPADGLFVDRFVQIPDYQVTRAQTLAVDMRTATVPLAVRTPRPAVVEDGDISWERDDATGTGISTVYIFGANADFRFAPGGPTRFGTQHFATRFRLTAPAGEPDRYTYDLRFDAPGNAIPSSLTYQVTPADLATLAATYYADGSREPWTVRFSFLSWQDFAFQALLPVDVPGRRTEYVAAGPALNWSERYIGVLETSPAFIVADEIDDQYRSYAAGEQQTIDWGRPVARPSLDVDSGVHPLPAFPFLCPACRKGDSIGIFVTPVADTTPGHFGFPDLPGDTPLGPVTSTVRWQLFQGSTLLSDLTDADGSTVDVPAGRADYRLVYQQTRTAPWYSQDTRSQTEWTFSSAHPAGPAAPAAWQCAPRNDGTTPAGDCAVLPLLTVNYGAAVDLTGRAPGGASHLGIAVAPTQGAPATTVTVATVEVSFDDGVTWTTAATTGAGAGRFDAAFTAPASGFVSTRVHATDAAGDTITQTVIRAYTIGAAA